MRQPDAARGDLEALDPITGEALPPAAITPRPAAASHTQRARRLRRVTAVLIALAAISATSAGYRATNVHALRRVEHAWRSAVAVDTVRSETDRYIVETLREFGDTDPTSATGAKGIVGRGEAARLASLADELRSIAVGDKSVRTLRDEMVAALGIRRLQLGPNRVEIGTSRLRDLTQRLDEELRRFRLAARPASGPGSRLAAANEAVAAIDSFADATTDTVLVGTAGSDLVIIDIDESLVRRTAVANGARVVFAREEFVVMAVDGRVEARSLSTPSSVLWSVPGDSAFYSSEYQGVVVVSGTRPTLLGPSGEEAFLALPRIPADRRAVAVTNFGFVLAGTESVPGPIEIFGPRPEDNRTVTPHGRFVAASDRYVAWEEDGPSGPMLHTSPITLTSAVSVRLPRTDLGTGAFSPNERVLAAPAGPSAGLRAVVLLYSRAGNQLSGLGAPSTSFDAASLAWSPDGNHLFWRTLDGRIAIYRAADSHSSALRVDIPDLQAFVVAARDR